jgi:hypothetical protein
VLPEEEEEVEEEEKKKKKKRKRKRKKKRSSSSFLHSSVTPSLLGPNILLSTLFSNTLSLRSSLNVSDQVSHAYKTTGMLSLRLKLIPTSLLKYVKVRAIQV